MTMQTPQPSELEKSVADRRQEIFTKTRSMPAMPTSAGRVFKIVRDPDYRIEDLSRAIEYDPTLTVNVLRLANSAMFGFSRSIGSVRDAIVRLGTENLLSLVVASNIAPIAQREIRGYDLPPGGLWEHSVFVAIASEEISKELKLNAPDFVFTAGLLHDIGKVALGTFVEVDSGPITKLAFDEKMSFEVAERKVLGTDHAEVGSLLLEHWELPPRIVACVRWHHDPEQSGGDRMVADIVHVADILGLLQGIGRGKDGLNYRSSQEAIARLGLKVQDVERILCSTLSKFNEIKEWFVGDVRR